MKRFLPITRELSLIREKHRVLIQYLRLAPGATLSCTAALSKQDLRRASHLLQGEGTSACFENDLGQVAWERSGDAIHLRFLDKGCLLAELRLDGQELMDWNRALTDLAPGN